MMSNPLILRLAETPELQSQCFHVRREVFVLEQGIDESDEIDHWEAHSRHWLAMQGQQAVGTARWRLTDQGIKLERFAVLSQARGEGIGSRLLDTVLEDIRRQLGDRQRIYLHAQESARRLYERRGFKPQGESFDECGIPHVLMALPTAQQRVA